MPSIEQEPVTSSQTSTSTSMTLIQQKNDQLHELLRALEAVQVQDDTMELDQPQEVDTGYIISFDTSINATASPTEPMATQAPSDAPEPTSNGGAMTDFESTTDIGEYFNADKSDCSFSSNPDAPLCNITAFRCTNSQTFLTVPFDYEIHHASMQTTSVSHLIQVIEGNIMDVLAMEMDLKSCAKSFGSRRLQATFSEQQLDRFTGISLLPRDVATTEACLVKLDESQDECHSVRGSLTLFTLLASNEGTISTEERNELSQAVLSVVQKGMSANRFLSSPNGETVVYIGDRETFHVSQSTTDSGWSASSIGLVSAACVLVVLVMAALCYIRFWFRNGKNRYVRDTSGSSVGSDPRNEANQEVGNHSSLAGQRVADAIPQLDAVVSLTEVASTWSQSESHEQGTEVIEFDKTSQFDPSFTSFEAATFDIVEMPTDIGNYQFSYEQGISPVNETFDNLYEDVELPSSSDDVSRGSSAKLSTQSG